MKMNREEIEMHMHSRRECVLLPCDSDNHTVIRYTLVIAKRTRFKKEKS